MTKHTRPERLMAAPGLQFDLPKNAKPADFVDHLIAEKKFLRDRDLNFRRVFLDTFDWRLFGRGFLMVCDFLEGRFRTTCRTLDETQVLATLSSEQIPIFVRDLPKGKVQKRLEPILEMRALLPQVRLDVRQQRLKILKKHDKTVLRLTVETCTVEDHTGKPKTLKPRINLERIRGYDEVFFKTAAWLETQQALRPPAENLLVTALARVARHPGDYSSKLDLKLDASMRSDAAFGMIFRRLFSSLERNESGTKQNLDSEFLHDFRVAVRRTRALLSESHQILADGPIGNFRRDFSWLGKASGTTRDLDVYLLNFESYQRRVPLGIRNDLQPLLDFLQAKQRLAHAELVKVLQSDRFDALKKKWRKFLDKPLAEKPEEFLAMQPVKPIADTRIWRVYKVIRKKGAGINQDSPPEKLHRLRIHCKKLRYLIEFFGSLYPEKEIRLLIKSLKTLQNNLGTFQDLKIQEETLREYSVEIMALPGAQRTLLAMGVLIQDLETQREAVRQEFVRCFEAFASAENRKLFRSLFKKSESVATQ
ncbi:MAG: CHAD domain-containing protein [Gammaproteobacteria bacterium]